jgi:hypothetical protein
MICSRCGNTLSERHDTAEFDDPYVGRISVNEADFLQCPKCDQKYFPLETVERIEVKRQERIDQEIGKFPISNFVGSSDAAAFLGITRQALHKNHKVRHGFIYRIRKSDGCMLYLIRSLKQYKETGDGRFTLFKVWNIEPPQYEYQKDELKQNVTYDSKSIKVTIPVNVTFGRKLESSKEIEYVR